MSVRITATGAVAFALLSWLTVPVSACDERYIKKCERAAAAVVAADDSAPVVKRRSASRVLMVASRHSRHMRFTKRTRAPGFTVRHGAALASAPSRLSNPVPETALSRRFRGFINPVPLAQNGFEPLRKPHIVALNLEPPAAPVPTEAVEEPITAPAVPAPQAAAPAPAMPSQQAAAPPAPVTMQLASAESRPVTLDAGKSTPALAAVAPSPLPDAAQTYVSEAPPAKEPAPNPFSVHQLVIALCGALGAASALRFIVGV